MSQIDLYIPNGIIFLISAYNKRIRSKRIWIECIVVLDAFLSFLHTKKEIGSKKNIDYLDVLLIYLDAFDKDKRNRNKKNSILKPSQEFKPRRINEKN